MAFDSDPHPNWMIDIRQGLRFPAHVCTGCEYVCVFVCVCVCVCECLCIHFIVDSLLEAWIVNCAAVQ